MQTRFGLSKVEKERAEQFNEKHRHKDVEKGAIGGHISYEFRPTGVGTSINIECGICGEKEDITDYSCW